MTEDSTNQSQAFEPPTKTCPDCAEDVKIAARKCRFCGYRWDGEDADVERNWEGEEVPARGYLIEPPPHPRGCTCQECVPRRRPPTSPQGHAFGCTCRQCMPQAYADTNQLPGYADTNRVPETPPKASGVDRLLGVVGGFCPYCLKKCPRGAKVCPHCRTAQM